MIDVSPVIKDKIEGALYAYFYNITEPIDVGGNIYHIDHQVGTRPLAWVRKMLLLDADAHTKDQWLQIVNQVFSNCGDEALQKYIMRRYGLREAAEDTCFELLFERSAYYRYRTALIYGIAIKAAAVGLL